MVKGIAISSSTVKVVYLLDRTFTPRTSALLVKGEWFRVRVSLGVTVGFKLIKTRKLRLGLKFRVGVIRVR